MAKIYTKTGDAGETQILGQSRRVIKCDPRVHALGSLDEVNAHIGHIRAALDLQNNGAHVSVDNYLSHVQNWLFDVGARLTMGEDGDFTAEVQHMEDWIDKWDSDLPQLKNFILPAGSDVVTRVHLARAAARRAERWVVEAFVDWALPFTNRLSDMLFVLARHLVHEAGEPEVIWTST